MSSTNEEVERGRSPLSNVDVMTPKGLCCLYSSTGSVLDTYKDTIDVRARLNVEE